MLPSWTEEAEMTTAQQAQLPAKPHTELAALEMKVPEMSPSEMIETMKLLFQKAIEIENTREFLEFVAGYTRLMLALFDRLHNFYNGEFKNMNNQITYTREFLSAGQKHLSELVDVRTKNLSDQVSGEVRGLKSEMNEKFDLLMKQLGPR